MNSPDWMERLQMLVARFPQYGADAGLSLLSEIELWGVYLFLSRHADD